MSERVMGTLFIDMKYVFLYHKLGFRETESDVYVKDYPDCSITIYSEEQLFEFKSKKISLAQHRDFVILELIDRLLGNGYRSSDIETFDLGVKLRELTIFCEQWGIDYEKALKNTSLESNQVLYESRLSGGLIDVEYRYNLNGKIYTKGLFEKEVKPFEFKPSVCEQSLSVPHDFKMIGTVLESYLGDDEDVVIPDGVTKIETGAFWNNIHVRKITIPESVEIIGGDAFVYCYELESVNIPSNVNDIGDDPFAGCPRLIITNTSPYFSLDDGVLFTSDHTRLIHYTPSKKDGTYRIPDTVEWVGKHSFYDCNNLKELTIGRKVDYMGNNPFSDCHNLILKNLSPNYIYKDGALLNKDGTTILHYSHGRLEGDYVVPDTVRTIGRNSFWNCKRIKHLTIGKNVRQIGYNPFANCSNLIISSNSPNYCVIDGILYDSAMRETFFCSPVLAKETVEMQPTVENIGRNTFSGCDSLKRVVIPSSVKTISRGAFSNCSSLEEVILPDGLELIEKWAFSYCPKLKSITIPSKTKLGSEVFIGSPTEVSHR